LLPLWNREARGCFGITDRRSGGVIVTQMAGQICFTLNASMKLSELRPVYNERHTVDDGAAQPPQPSHINS
jgi:hypothetical protein